MKNYDWIIKRHKEGKSIQLTQLEANSLAINLEDEKINNLLIIYKEAKIKDLYFGYSHIIEVFELEMKLRSKGMTR